MRDTIDMAREVKATAYTNRHYPDRTTYTFGTERLKAFADLVRADEREACAKLAQSTVCDTHIPTGVKIYGTVAAKAIRARGETK